MDGSNSSQGGGGMPPGAPPYGVPGQPGYGMPPYMPPMMPSGMPTQGFHGPPSGIPPFPSALPPGMPPAMPGMPAQKSLWSEHKAPDGRTYFYHAETKQSAWEKPDELKSPVEVSRLLCC